MSCNIAPLCEALMIVSVTCWHAQYEVFMVAQVTCWWGSWGLGQRSRRWGSVKDECLLVSRCCYILLIHPTNYRLSSQLPLFVVGGFNQAPWRTVVRPAAAAGWSCAHINLFPSQPPPPLPISPPLPFSLSWPPHSHMYTSTHARTHTPARYGTRHTNNSGDVRNKKDVIDNSPFCVELWQSE